MIDSSKAMFETSLFSSFQTCHNKSTHQPLRWFDAMFLWVVFDVSCSQLFFFFKLLESHVCLLLVRFQEASKKDNVALLSLKTTLEVFLTLMLCLVDCWLIGSDILFDMCIVCIWLDWVGLHWGWTQENGYISYILSLSWLELLLFESFSCSFHSFIFPISFRSHIPPSFWQNW